MLCRDIQIIDFIWIDPAANGLSASAEANLKNLLADAKTNYVLVRAESNFSWISADHDKVRLISIAEPARRLKREAWVSWLIARALLSGRDIFYTSWLPRLCLSVLFMPVKCRIFVHDLNIFRSRVFDTKFPQPSFRARLHQYLSIKRATVVQSFAHSVARQLKLLRRDAITVVSQTVRVITPTNIEKRPASAVIFLDDRNYKGTWALNRFYSSTKNFQLTVIGKIDPANGKLLASRGISVRALRPSNEDKFKLLAEAEYVIFASKYEGFGLPPREAAAVGTPSLIARRAALLDIPTHLSLSIDAFCGDIDLAEIPRLAAHIDLRAIKQWAAGFLGPTSTSWLQHSPGQAGSYVEDLRNPDRIACDQMTSPLQPSNSGCPSPAPPMKPAGRAEIRSSWSSERVS